MYLTLHGSTLVESECQERNEAVEIARNIRIEHSENKIIMYLENEVGPGVLQSSVQQI